MRLIGMPASTQAAGLFVAAFNHVFEDDPTMTVRVRRADGTGVEVAGELDDYEMRFSPAAVSAVVGEIAGVLDDPAGRAVLSVTVPDDRSPNGSGTWAWNLPDLSTLTSEGARMWLDEPASYLGAEHGGHDIQGAFCDLDATALTDDVKGLLLATDMARYGDHRPGTAASYLYRELRIAGFAARGEGDSSGGWLAMDLGDDVEIWINGAEGPRENEISYPVGEHRGWLACFYPDGGYSGEFEEIYRSQSNDLRADTRAVVAAVAARIAEHRAAR
ncbi:MULTISPECIES: hypothetical protein [unclassified Streptomyces]|uniref:hypothetical protein n=1 Tax=unclassified Streptomyces TaxID=2593676 RepID=UPI00035C28D2|nr:MULTISPECIES: hypothetical protein [unclassified Streptomyces]MYX39008.1 hypothetical protein [Streptomyces sp. SID8377]